MFCLRGNRAGHGHCGLVIYVHTQFKSSSLILHQESTDWDYLCVELSHCKPKSKKYLLCNIYRLPGLIVDEFKLSVISILTLIRNVNHSTFICGDFNIDLLKIDSNKHFGSYFDRILASFFS